MRSIVLGASPEITEGIKWKSLSFRIKDDFATLNIRKDAVWVIFHQGAKATKASATGITINDPTGLLEWLAKDRAVVKFLDVASIEPTNSIDTSESGYRKPKGRGRDASYRAPPAQIRTGATNAYGSYLGYLASNRTSG